MDTHRARLVVFDDKKREVPLWFFVGDDGTYDFVIDGCLFARISETAIIEFLYRAQFINNLSEKASAFYSSGTIILVKDAHTSALDSHDAHKFIDDYLRNSVPDYDFKVRLAMLEY